MSFKEFKEFWIDVFANYAGGYGVETDDGKKIVIGGEPIATVIVEGAGIVPINKEPNLSNEKNNNM